MIDISVSKADSYVEMEKKADDREEQILEYVQNHIWDNARKTYETRDGHIQKGR